MSVNPGWGGQPFLGGSVAKVGRLHDEALAAGSRLDDRGGRRRSADNAGSLCAAGADILVAGTDVYGSGDPARAIGKLREAARVSVRA